MGGSVLSSVRGLLHRYSACRLLVIWICLAVSGIAVPASAQRMNEAEFNRAVQALGDDSPERRVEAIESIGRRGWRHRRAATPHLRRLLRRDPSWEVRASSGRAIGRLSVRAAVPDLVAALRDPKVEVRVVAAAALWRLPDPAAVPALLRLIDDDDPAARQWAALALGVIRDPRAVEPIAGLLDDSEKSVRTDSIRALGRIGHVTALRPLRRFLDSNHPDDEKLEAIDAIASVDSPDKVNVLVRLLQHDSADVRSRTVRALGQVGDALAIPALRRYRSAIRSPAARREIDTAMRAIRERMAEQ